MQSLLYLPPAISFLIVSGITTAIALGGLYLVRRKYPAEVLKENHEVAAIIFNAFGLFYGVMVAFVVFVTWSGYSEGTKNLEMEASEVDDIFHSAEALPEPARSVIRQGLMDYTASVYDELKAMQNGEIALHSTGAMPKLLTTFYQLDEKSVSNRELYSDTLTRLNNLAEYRRMRIFAANDTVPSAVWMLLLIGGVFTVSYTFFFGMKNIKAQYVLTTTLTVTISLILFLIYVLDHPFTGANRVSTEPLRQVMEVIQKE